MKVKGTREPPLKVTLAFDDAIGRALTVKPPSGGWKKYEAGLRAKQPRKPTTKARAKKKIDLVE